MASQNHTLAAALLRRCLFFPANRMIIPSFHLLELSLAVAAFLLLHCLRQKQRYGVAVWPVLGMTPTLAAAVRGDLYEWLTGVLRRRNGTFTFQGPWFTSLCGVVTCDPRNLEHLLKSNFPNFPKGPYFRENVRDLLGDGIFGADHDSWQRQRRVASLEFHSARFRRSTVDSVHDLVHARLLPVLDGACDGGAIDLQDVLLRLTFDNVCMIAFGVDPGCLRPGLPEIPFARAFEDATAATLNRFVTPTLVWKAMRSAGLGVEKRLKESIRCVDEFAAEVIRTRKKELAVSSGRDGEERADLLTAFMGMKEETGAAFSDKFLRDICVNFILAGRDTSSVALAWFFWLLDRNPAAETKIMEEIRRVAAEREQGGGGGGGGGDASVLGPEEVKKMEYLQAALSESLRLYPSVPLDHKEVVEDDVFPDGTVVKKGTKVIYAIYAMGRMESIWGEDCRKFRPERWLREGRFVAESAYKFAAFNGGPRLCLGKDFAYYQMKLVAASVLRRFRVRVVEHHPVTPKLSLTMYVKHGLRVLLSRRHEAPPPPARSNY